MIKREAWYREALSERELSLLWKKAKQEGYRNLQTLQEVQYALRRMDREEELYQKLLEIVKAYPRSAAVKMFWEEWEKSHFSELPRVPRGVVMRIPRGISPTVDTAYVHGWDPVTGEEDTQLVSESLKLVLGLIWSKGYRDQRVKGWESGSLVLLNETGGEIHGKTYPLSVLSIEDSPGNLDRILEWAELRR